MGCPCRRCAVPAREGVSTVAVAAPTGTVPPARAAWPTARRAASSAWPPSVKRTRTVSPAPRAAPSPRAPPAPSSAAVSPKGVRREGESCDALPVSPAGLLPRGPALRQPGVLIPVLARWECEVRPGLRVHRGAGYGPGRFADCQQRGCPEGQRCARVREDQYQCLADSRGDCRAHSVPRRRALQHAHVPGPRRLLVREGLQSRGRGFVLRWRCLRHGQRHRQHLLPPMRPVG